MPLKVSQQADQYSQFECFFLNRSHYMQGTKRIMVTVLLNSKRGESCREGQVNYVNSHYDPVTTEIMQT